MTESPQATARALADVARYLCRLSCPVTNCQVCGYGSIHAERAAEILALVTPTPRPPSDGEAAELRRLAERWVAALRAIEPGAVWALTMPMCRAIAKVIEQAAARLDALEGEVAQWKWHKEAADICYREADKRADAAEQRAERAETALKRIANAHAFGLTFGDAQEWAREALAEGEERAATAEQRAEAVPERICLVCGAKEPCMTDADLKPGDPGTPCTFEPTAAELWKRLQAADARAEQRDAETRRAAIAECLALAEKGMVWQAATSSFESASDRIRYALTRAAASEEGETNGRSSR